MDPYHICSRDNRSSLISFLRCVVCASQSNSAAPNGFVRCTGHWGSLTESASTPPVSHFSQTAQPSHSGMNRQQTKCSHRHLVMSCHVVCVCVFVCVLWSLDCSAGVAELHMYISVLSRMLLSSDARTYPSVCAATVCCADCRLFTSLFAWMCCPERETHCQCVLTVLSHRKCAWARVYTWSVRTCLHIASWQVLGARTCPYRSTCVAHTTREVLTDVRGQTQEFRVFWWLHINRPTHTHAHTHTYSRNLGMLNLAV
jgi:hypothetical protein